MSYFPKLKDDLSKSDWAGFLIFVLVFVSHDSNLAEMSIAKSRLSVPYGTNFYCYKA